MTTWLAVLGVGLGSYVLRVGPLLLRSRYHPSARTDDLIRQAGTAALAALLVTSCLRVWQTGPVAPTALALGVGATLALRGASMRRIVAVGLACQFVLDLVM